MADEHGQGGPPEGPGGNGDPHMQSTLDVEVSRFLGLTGALLIPLVWFLGVAGPGTPAASLPLAVAIGWIMFLAFRRSRDLGRDLNMPPVEGYGRIQETGRNYLWLGRLGTHMGSVVIEGMHFGIARGVADSLEPGARVRIWYYIHSRHVLRIEQVPAAPPEEQGGGGEEASERASLHSGTLAHGSHELCFKDPLRTVPNPSAPRDHGSQQPFRPRLGVSHTIVPAPLPWPQRAMHNARPRYRSAAPPCAPHSRSSME